MRAAAVDWVPSGDRFRVKALTLSGFEEAAGRKQAGVASSKQQQQQQAYMIKGAGLGRGRSGVTFLRGRSIASCLSQLDQDFRLRMVICPMRYRSFSGDRF